MLKKGRAWLEPRGSRGRARSVLAVFIVCEKLALVLRSNRQPTGPMHTEPSSPHSCRARPLLLILGIATVATLLHSAAPFLSEAEQRGLLKPEPCKDIGRVATTLITDGVNFVLAEIPGSRIQAKTRELGIQAEVKVGVGMASSTTKITNITYNACAVGGLKMTSCKTRGKLVQVVPDTVALRIEGLVLNITIEYWSGVAVVGRGNTKNMTVTGHACEPAVASPLSPPFSANAR